MNKLMLIVLVICLLEGCASSAPRTAWGKVGVSMVEYRIDAGQCAVLAASSEPMKGVPRTAGGIHGSNPAVRKGEGAEEAKAAGPGQRPDPGTPQSTSGGFYRESASADFVNRAAMQQRTQELTAQREGTQRLKQCLSDRGYTEFYLTPEQRKHLSTLPKGSEERREYLYKLGTDPKVLGKR